MASNDFTMAPKAESAPAATATVADRAASSVANQNRSEYAPPDDLGPAVTKDSQELRNQVYEQAFAALAALPEGTRKAEAFKIATAAQNSFLNMVKNGIPAGTALTNARAAVPGWISDVAGTQGVQATPPNQLTGNSPNPVGSADVRNAQGVYTEAVQAGRDLYGNVNSGPVNPSPTDIAAGKVVWDPVTASYVTPQRDITAVRQAATTVGATDTSGVRAAGNAQITPGTVTAGTVSAEQMTPAQRLAAAQQRATTVQATDTGRLEQVADGQGPVAQGLAANLRLAQQRSTQQRQGLVAQARGNERRGARRALITGGGAEDLAVADTIIARTTEQQVAATGKLADLDNQRKTLQAQLDAARAANDQNAINTISMKMADLDAERERTNATLRQSAAEGNVNRQTEAQKFNVTTQTEAQKFQAAQKLQAETKLADLQQAQNIAQAQLDQAKAAGDQNAINAANMKMADIRAQVATTNAQLAQDANKFNTTTSVGVQEKDRDTMLQGQQQAEAQRIADADMRIRAQKALEDSARGLLNEDQRQQTLDMARQQMALAEQQFQLAKDEAARAQANENRRFWAGVISSVVSGVATGGASLAMPKAAQGGVTAGPTLAGEGNRPELVIPIEGKLSDRMRAALAVDNKPFAKGMPASRLAAVLAAANLVDRKAKAS
jgi:hypothetical protein